MSAFGDAFKAARAAGKKTFTFNGKSYHTRTKEDETKSAPKAAAKPKSSDLDREINREGARQVQASQETAMQKTTPKADKKDDTSLSLSERMNRTKERARTSNTGTDTRSVSQRIKEAIGMKKGGSVKAAKKGNKARGTGAATRGTKFSGVF